MASTLIAIKLGSTLTTIYREGEGLVLREPSLIAVSGTIRSREIKAVGKEAKKLIGRTGDGQEVISPISSGIIVDSELATEMLKRFLKQIEVHPKLFKGNIRAIVCIPLGISLVERKTIEKVCYNAGINDVILIPAIICSAYGEDIDVEGPQGKLLVNIGGGATNIAVMANNQILTGLSVAVGGTNITVAITKLIEDKYNLKVSPLAAEELKQNIISLYPDSKLEAEITGIDKDTKESKTITVSSNEVHMIVEHYYSKIIEAINACLANCTPEIIKDVAEDGIYLFGSGAFVSGLERFFKEKTGLPIKIGEHAKTDIYGAAKLINNSNALRDILLNV